MTNRSLQTTLGLGIAGSLALAIASPVNAQSSGIPITGGRAVFNDTQIFVPDPNSINNQTVVFEGDTPDSVFIRTTQGNIPINAKFTSSTLPSIFSSPGEPPRIGDTGQVFGTLTFRGFTAAGEPGLFANIPTELNFQITSGNFNSAVIQEATKYQSEPKTLTETGFIATPTSFTTTERTIPVVVVQFQPNSNPPEELTLTDVTPVTTFAPSDFIDSIPGTSYAISFDTNLTGGSVDIPTPPGLNATGTPSGNIGNNLGFNEPTNITAVFIENRVNINVETTGIVGFVQTAPVLPTTFVTGIFTFTNVRSGAWFDPPITEGFEYEMIPRDIPIGLASRVFPGVIGRDTASDAVFTAISGFPENVDADDRFTVSVEGETLGEFGPGDTLQFSDYEAQLGDLLVDGGVTKFTVSAIDPGVDSADPTAFPLKLEFNTPTASFEMRALDMNASDVNASEQAVEADGNLGAGLAVETIPVHENPELSMAQITSVSEMSDADVFTPSEMPMMDIEYSRNSLGEETQSMVELGNIQPNSDQVEKTNADVGEISDQIAEINTQTKP